MSPAVNPYAQGHGPYPDYKRVMVFVDGENLVCRYKEILKDSNKTDSELNVYSIDIYAWNKAQ